MYFMLHRQGNASLLRHARIRYKYDYFEDQLSLSVLRYTERSSKTKWLFCTTYLFLHPTMVFSMQSAVNCTVVGDGFVGKSCLVQKIAGGKFHQEYVATLKDNYSTKLSLNGDSFEMNITDIAGEVSQRVLS